MQTDIAKAAGKAATDVTRGTVQASTAGLVVIDKKFKCVKILGRKVCR